MKAVLLLIDVQPEWYSQSQVCKVFPHLAANTTALLATCRASGTEVIHIRARYDDDCATGLPGGHDWAKWRDSFRALSPEKACTIDGTTSVEPFAAEQPGERLFLKPEWDAFNGTLLAEYLAQQQVTKVLVAGLVTSACVQHTAHGAFARGYEVELVQDCCGDRTVEQHQGALRLYGGYMYRVTDSRALAAQLSGAGAGLPSGGLPLPLPLAAAPAARAAPAAGGTGAAHWAPAPAVLASLSLVSLGAGVAIGLALARR